MDVSSARAHLQAGGLLAFPTETLWSLSCRADCPDAVAKIFATKQRGQETPLAVGFVSLAQASQYVDVAGTEALATLLPGPLTLVLPMLDGRLQHVAPGRTHLGVRVPDHPIAQALLADGPLVMTSANAHGAPDALVAADVEHLGVPIVGDERVAGVASTVLQLQPWQILRPGAMSATALAAYKKTK